MESDSIRKMFYPDQFLWTSYERWSWQVMHERIPIFEMVYASSSDQESWFPRTRWRSLNRTKKKNWLVALQEWFLVALLRKKNWDMMDLLNDLFGNEWLFLIIDVIFKLQCYILQFWYFLFRGWQDRIRPYIWSCIFFRDIASMLCGCLIEMFSKRTAILISYLRSLERRGGGFESKIMLSQS